MKALFQTDDGWAGFILRFTLGLVMFPHGAQKLFGWYGGFGFDGIGRLALLAGLLTRFTAASLAVIMLGAITMVHLPHGFFMNWFGKQQGEGYEYHLLVIGIAATLLVIGAGRWSIDREVAAKIAH